MSCGCYTVDFPFRQTYGPNVSLAEGKNRFIGKDKAYYFKTEASVFPNWSSLLCVVICIFGNCFSYSHIQEKSRLCSEQLDKIQSECSTADSGLLRIYLKIPGRFFFDNGYQGARYMTWVLHSKKGARGFELISAEENENKIISSERIIVEMFWALLQLLGKQVCKIHVV